MVSNIGYKLSNTIPITGFGIHHYRCHPIHGRGPIRRVTESIVGTIGHALVNRLATAIAGNGYKPTGTGVRRLIRNKRPRRPIQTLTHIGEYRRRPVGRARTRKPRTVHHSISALLGPIAGVGYRRRKPRKALIGMGRRRRVHRNILII